MPIFIFKPNLYTMIFTNLDKLDQYFKDKKIKVIDHDVKSDDNISALKHITFELKGTAIGVFVDIKMSTYNNIIYNITLRNSQGRYIMMHNDILIDPDNQLDYLYLMYETHAHEQLINGEYVLYSILGNDFTNYTTYTKPSYGVVGGVPIDYLYSVKNENFIKLESNFDPVYDELISELTLFKDSYAIMIDDFVELEGDDGTKEFTIKGVFNKRIKDGTFNINTNLTLTIYGIRVQDSIGFVKVLLKDKFGSAKEFKFTHFSEEKNDNKKDVLEQLDKILKRPVL